MRYAIHFAVALLTVGLVGSVQATAAEQALHLSLSAVIELSSATAPGVLLSGSRMEEGEARLETAAVRALENPKLEVSAGPRSGTETGLDAEIGLEVPVELGNRREKRIAVAKAFIERDRHAVAETRRHAVAAAVLAYFRVLQAEERVVLTQERKALAEELLRAAKERHAAGDVARFDMNLAQAEVARADSEAASARGKVAAAKGELALALGLPSASGLTVAGSIRDRSFFDGIYAAPAPASRADLLVAQAELEGSRAAVTLAGSERLPDLALTASVKREGDESVILGGVSVTLPFFNAKKGAVREAAVQHRRAQLALELSRNAFAAEIERARTAYAEAVRALGSDGSDLVALGRENMVLAQQGYRAGKLSLADLLQLRRDALETSREYLERAMEAAEAGVELASTSGAWPLAAK